MNSLLNGEKCLPGGLIAQRIEVREDTVIIEARFSQSSNLCPGCGRCSRYRHGLYRRNLADLPAHGHRVQIDLTVHRYRCAAPDCHRRIVSETSDPAVTWPDGRRTTRLQGLVRHLGHLMGGRSAQALARPLLLPVSKDTFLPCGLAQAKP